MAASVAATPRAVPLSLSLRASGDVASRLLLLPSFAPPPRAGRRYVVPGLLRYCAAGSDL